MGSSAAQNRPYVWAGGGGGGGGGMEVDIIKGGGEEGRWSEGEGGGHKGE